MSMGNGIYEPNLWWQQAEQCKLNRDRLLKMNRHHLTEFLLEYCDLRQAIHIDPKLYCPSHEDARATDISRVISLIKDRNTWTGSWSCNVYMLGEHHLNAYMVSKKEYSCLSCKFGFTATMKNCHSPKSVKLTMHVKSATVNPKYLNQSSSAFRNWFQNWRSACEYSICHQNRHRQKRRQYTHEF